MTNNITLSSWEIQAVVTKDLQPYLEVDSHSTNII